MQKQLLLLTLCLLTTAHSAQTSAKRYVLIEHFTNSKCSSCARKIPAFYNLIDDYPDDIHHISIHPPYPYSTCALYQANTTENKGRSDFYGVFGTPSVALNGVLQPISTPLLSNTTLQEYLGDTSPLWLKVEESGPNNARVATITAHSLSAIPGGSYKIYAAVMEKTINFNGGNGELVHHDVFRKMLAGINGSDFTPAPAGQTVTHTFNFSINANWNANEIYVLAWVQNTATEEVLNSGTRFDAQVTGADDLPAQSVRIQPNPATSTAWAFIGDDAAQQVEVFAANGQRVAVSFENETPGTVEIATENLAPGIYFVKITGSKGFYTAKMVREKTGF